MKQQLWILNSALVGLFFCSLGVLIALFQTAPRTRSFPSIEELTVEKPYAFSVPLEQIAQDNFFGLPFVSQTQTTRAPAPVPALPQFKKEAASPAPQEKKHDFIPPLSIKLNGLILSSDEAKSIALVTDEAGVEKMYHVGEKIKDATLIAIFQDRVSLLRANGQKETFYLRQPGDMLPGVQPTEVKWNRVFEMIEEKRYRLDPQAFATKIASLGELIELLSLVPVYEKDEQVGIMIGKIDPDLAVSCGMKNKDVIKQINGIMLNSPKERIRAYEALISFKKGSLVSVMLLREGRPLEITYLLEEIKEVKAKEEQGKKSSSLESSPLVIKKQTENGGKEEGRISSLTQQFTEVKTQESKDYFDSIESIRRRLMESAQNSYSPPRP